MSYKSTKWIDTYANNGFVNAPLTRPRREPLASDTIQGAADTDTDTGRGLKPNNMKCVCG